MQACLNASSNLIAYDTCARAILAPDHAVIVYAASIAACAIVAHIASRYL